MADNEPTTTSTLLQTMLASTVRHGVAAVAVYFASKGILQPDQQGAFTDLISGSAVAALMLGWSLLQKFVTHARVVGLRQAFDDYVRQTGGVPASGGTVIVPATPAVLPEAAPLTKA
jgi:hypothetical protein